MRTRNLFTLGLAVLWLLTAGAAAQKNKPDSKNAAAPAQVVDSGAFGVYVSGKRIATETFSIQQRADQITAGSELQMEEGGGAGHKSELHLSPNGDLKRYQWRELSPGKAEISVSVDEVFLVQKVSVSPADKPVEMTHMLPPSTAVLDDYCFMHRQLLLWRYLGAACGSDLRACKLPRAQLAAFIPRQHTSSLVTLQYMGREKLLFGGAERELSRFHMESEDVVWMLWLDTDHKLVRVAVPALNIEVLRE